MEDAISQQYARAVLSYAPNAQWHVIIDHFCSNTDVLPVHHLLAADAYFSLFDQQKARQILQNIPCNSSIQTLISASEELQALYLALQAWAIEGDLAAAFQHFMSALKQSKRNLFYCKRAQLMALIAGKNRDILQPALLVVKENQGRDFFAGMLVFGYEQAEEFEKAEMAAKEAQAAGRPDGWLDHGFAHSLYFQGKNRIEEAKAFLEKRKDSWSLENMMPFLYTHLWWHYALVLTESGNVQEAIQIFDAQLWPEGKDVSGLDRIKFCFDVEVRMGEMKRDVEIPYNYCLLFDKIKLCFNVEVRMGEMKREVEIPYNYCLLFDKIKLCFNVEVRMGEMKRDVEIPYNYCLLFDKIKLCFNVEVRMGEMKRDVEIPYNYCLLPKLQVCIAFWKG